MNWKKTLLISLAILIVAAAVTFVIFRTEPTAKIGGATKETAMLVDVVRVTRGNYEPTIVTTGTVVPSKDISLSPRVSGEVVYISENFTPGGFVRKGETLLQIDPSDYRNALQLRESELLQAEADLNIEMGRQNVALKDYQLLENEFDLEDKSLVLREPQLKAARSKVAAGNAAVNQTNLDLQRTTLKAPFNAHILSRNVNTGSQVSPGQDLGRLVGQDVYWIEITVPLARLKWLSFPDSETKKGASVKIRHRSSQDEEWREGNLFKMIGSLEGQTRMARILAEVEDPLATVADTLKKTPLILGSFVEAGIRADEIKNVFRLSRDYVRTNETVWVMVNEKLQIRDVDIVFQDAEYAYVVSGLNDNEKVVTTNLSTVTEGVSLRIESSHAEKTGESNSEESVAEFLKKSEEGVN
ncbi:efflux RND transporter periplasmic adaptor subunit [Maribellus maritimus]|uniref:efflux RND transporter periplasmic adaptor subunit n=1 Tax=Maribellus maritimus TaxID=2870838 RepID=UPI001EEB84C9|nr:efflux RND transporter periplasmic adaptor subunit [Maribellus maritimus]MCG6186745.1 efflux RND transporter periplasmic adaptor subunit [Maribellus maritimus]